MDQAKVFDEDFSIAAQWKSYERCMTDASNMIPGPLREILGTSTELAFWAAAISVMRMLRVMSSRPDKERQSLLLQMFRETVEYQKTMVSRNMDSPQ